MPYPQPNLGALQQLLFGEAPGPVKGAPKINIKDVARSYKLHRVPKLVWDFDEILYQMGEDWEENAAAAFSPNDWKLHLGHLLMKPNWLTSTYNQSRFHKAGVPTKLEADDALRFIVAHETYHAAQDEHGPWVPSTIRDPNHDKLKIEIDADKMAAKVYHLVKVNGR